MKYNYWFTSLCFHLYFREEKNVDDITPIYLLFNFVPSSLMWLLVSEMEYAPKLFDAMTDRLLSGSELF